MTLDRGAPQPRARAHKSFRLTPKHVRAIEALADLVVDGGGFGEITLEFIKGRIARLGKKTTESYIDENHTENGH